MRKEIINPKILETSEILENYNKILVEERELLLIKKCLRRELDLRLKDKPYLDLNYYVELKPISQFRLDNVKVKSYLGDRIKDFEKEIISYRLKIKLNR